MSAPSDDLMGNPISNPLEDTVEETEPSEILIEGSDEELEISVVDDRPEEDRVEPRDPDRSKDFDPDADVGELSGRAGKRIKQLRYEYHEQRREREAAEKMRDEAVRYAQQMGGQNTQLKDLLQRGESVLLSEIKARTESELSKARDHYRAAYAEGDVDAVLKAQEDLTRSHYDSRLADQYRPLEQEPVMGQPPPQLQQQQPQPQQVPPDPKLKQWLGENSWFGKDSELTSFAYGVHEKLVREGGVDPRSEEYYSAIDKRMREVFPNKFGGVEGAEEPVARHRTTTVVAPARRSVSSPRKVQLTSTQVALAKRLGLSPEQYAKQLLKESGNG